MLNPVNVSLHQRVLKSPRLRFALGLLFVSAIRADEPKKEHRYAYDAMSERNSMDSMTGGHWFNCGPTGIRSSIENERPTEFLVKYVFDHSPAHGKIRAGDRIVGANGKKWKEEDPLLRGAHASFGYYGPRRMLGLAIEESEGLKGDFSGRLSLDVIRDGQQLTIDVPLKPIGQFGPNFPYDDAKSDLLIEKACEFLIENADPGNCRWQGHGDVTYMAILGLLAQGDEYRRFIKNFIDANYGDQPPGDDPEAWTWCKAMDGVKAAELYLATKDKRLIPYMEDLDKWYSKARTPWGAYKHHPYVRPGEGYGPMAHPTALTCTAWALFKRCGVKIDEASYIESRHLVDLLTGPSGSIGYGADLPEGENAVPATVKIAKGDPDSGTPWRSYGATGYATMFHYLDPMEHYSDYYVERGVKAVAYCKELIPDGHASSGMSLWAGFMTAALAPAIGRKDVYREFMDYYKAWLNVNRCHDGSFYGTPNRDVNNDGYTGTRFNTTGAVVLLLSAPKRKLRILGADDPRVQPAAAARPSPFARLVPAPSSPSERAARKMSPENLAILDKGLKGALANVSARNGLKQVPVAISLARASVWLKAAKEDGTLTFQAFGGEQTADFAWSRLSVADRATLATMLANLKPGSKDVQAMAGAYMESSGKVGEADAFYEKAGEESRKKFDVLFE